MPDPAITTTATETPATTNAAVQADPNANAPKAANTAPVAPPLLFLSYENADKIDIYRTQVHLCMAGCAALATPEWGDLKNTLSQYSAVELPHVVIFAHSTPDGLILREPDENGVRTSSSKSLLQVADILKEAKPRIKRLDLDGCRAGEAVYELFQFASILGIQEVNAWNYYHALKPFIRTLPPPIERNQAMLDAELAALDAELAAIEKFIPKGDAGSTFTATELNNKMASTRQLSVLAEFFVEVKDAFIESAGFLDPNNINERLHVNRADALSNSLKRPCPTRSRTTAN